MVILEVIPKHPTNDKLFFMLKCDFGLSRALIFDNSLTLFVEDVENIRFGETYRFFEIFKNKYSRDHLDNWLSSLTQKDFSEQINEYPAMDDYIGITTEHNELMTEISQLVNKNHPLTDSINNIKIGSIPYVDYLSLINSSLTVTENDYIPTNISHQIKVKPSLLLTKENLNFAFESLNLIRSMRPQEFHSIFKREEGQTCAVDLYMGLRWYWRENIGLNHLKSYFKGLLKSLENFEKNKEYDRILFYSDFANIVSSSHYDGLRTVFYGSDSRLGITEDFDITINCLVSGDRDVYTERELLCLVDKSRVLSHSRLCHFNDVFQEFQDNLPSEYESYLTDAYKVLHFGLKAYASGHFALDKLKYFMTKAKSRDYPIHAMDNRKISSDINSVDS